MRSLIIIALMAASFGLMAQSSQTVSMGAGYANQAYYDLNTRTETNVSATGWDLQIVTNTMSATIRINSGEGASLYAPANQDTTNWASIDTAGATEIYGTDTSWEDGAFLAQSGTNGAFDYGWGEYNTTTHNLTGFRTFIIETVGGNWKKVWIKNLVGGTEYNIRLADLDGSNDTTITLDKTNYNTKSFFYYSLDNMQVVDQEPVTEGWDIVFRRYETSFGPGTYYPVSGGLTNVGVSVAEVSDVDTSYNNFQSQTFAENISVIGYDWKSYDQANMVYNIADSLVYFVDDVEGYIYKLVFTDFGGSANGNISFNQTTVYDPSVVGVEEISTLNYTEVYPNPVQDRAKLVISSQQNTEVLVSLTDMTGKLHIQRNYQVQNGINTVELATERLHAGMYLVTIDNGQDRVITKLLKAE